MGHNGPYELSLSHCIVAHFPRALTWGNKPNLLKMEPAVGTVKSSIQWYSWDMLGPMEPDFRFQDVPGQISGDGVRTNWFPNLPLIIHSIPSIPLASLVNHAQLNKRPCHWISLQNVYYSYFRWCKRGLLLGPKKCSGWIIIIHHPGIRPFWDDSWLHPPSATSSGWYRIFAFTTTLEWMNGWEYKCACLFIYIYIYTCACVCVCTFYSGSQP